MKIDNSKTNNLFGDNADTDNNLFSDPSIQSGQLEVVQMEFAGAESVSWQELFAGYDRLYAITYSSGIKFISELLQMYEYAEIIFGSEEVMSYNLSEIIAFQSKTLERVRAVFSKTKIDLVDRIDHNKLKLFVAKQKLSHEKIYLLEANDGRKRVIMGSANMSYAAFTGKQRENISYIEGDRAFDWYKDSFDELKEMSSDSVTIQALKIADAGENLAEIPVMGTVKVKKSMIIEPNTEVNEEVKFVLSVKNLAHKIASYMPKADKKGKILLLPEMVIQTKRRIMDGLVQEKELRSEYPELVIDIPDHQVLLNDTVLDLEPEPAAVKNDVELFLEYMEGYEKFHGDVAGMQAKYYAFANWFFTTPFMAVMRDMAAKYNQNLMPYPVFGLVYGKSKAGKTSFLETLLKMMIGQKTKIAAPDFTKSNIDGLKRTVRGAPVIVDDLTQTRFSQHAVEMIKNDQFGVAESLIHYPAVVISANEDVKAVAQEIIRRTVLCHVQAGLKNTEIMKTSVVRRVQKNIGTAFYREYLRRMLYIMPDLLQSLQEDENDGTPDILQVSSVIIYDIVAQYADRKTPDYIRKLTLDDYFSEKVTGSQAIKKIKDAWQINRKAFEVDKKHSQLHYNAGESWEAERIIKELPEDLQARKSGGNIAMDLEVACSFFEIDFKKHGGLLRFIRK
ncbi:MAG TPA: phospholipase D family protein [Syntrophomonadaceae bacterium]|nr:phospholipase D family protein [Syntrophomonadaceae bacterium]HPR94377.1 phospholipase D family protein [Syntrophomonadaceae bacterium]